MHKKTRRGLEHALQKSYMYLYRQCVLRIANTNVLLSRPYRRCVMTQATMAAVEQSAVRKISWRLVPFVALMFFINFLDRTAISFAGPNGMT